MDIITQKEADVKTPLDEWREKKTENIRVSERMRDAGFITRAYRMRECATILNNKICPECGKSYISSANLCRDRFCPTCAWRLSVRRFANMCEVLDHINNVDQYTAGFLTLTIENCKPSELRMTIDKMAEDFNRLMCRPAVKKNIIGWARSLEVTANVKRHTFHPHFHIILLFDKEIDEGQYNAFFKQAWQKAARLPYSPITDFRLITRPKHDTGGKGSQMYKAVLETFKYAVKSKDLLDMPIGMFRSMVNALDGVRMIGYGGLIRKVRAQLNKDEEKEIDEGEEDALLRDKCECGADLVAIVMEWSFGEGRYKMFDFGKP